MERTALPATGGMIFDCHSPRRVAKSMNAPPIRLDMIFVSEDGGVVAIMSNEPPVSDDFVSLGVAVSAVSELNAGAAAIGLCPADKVGRPIYPRLGGGNTNERAALFAPTQAAASPNQEHTGRVTPRRACIAGLRAHDSKKAR